MSWPDGEFLLPLFPLPHLVFFPVTRLPLHIFEPRYRRLISDVVSADKRFGIVLLRPGWEADYFGAPAIHGTGTLGEIEHVASLDDGKYNILVRGEVRFRVVGEVVGEPYRTARVVAQPQSERSVTDAYAQRTWLAELAKQYLRHLPEQDGVPEIETVGLEALTNALIMSLNLEVEEKQRLLENDDLIARAETIGNDLQSRIESLRFLAPYRKGSGDPSRN